MVLRTGVEDYQAYGDRELESAIAEVDINTLRFLRVRMSV